jgi:IS5 family transposase
MKAHIGVDSGTKLIHSVAATAANVHDSRVLPSLLHGDERRVWGDAAYTGQGEAIKKHAPFARDFTQRKSSRSHPLSEAERSRNRTKSRVRAKVEHPFLVLKRIFGFCKVRCRGIKKNANRLFTACGLVNLYMVRRRLLRATQGQCARSAPWRVKGNTECAIAPSRTDNGHNFYHHRRTHGHITEHQRE